MAGTGAFNSAAAGTTLACLLCLVLTTVSVQSAPASYPEERFLETTELAEYGNLGGSGAGAGPGGGIVEPSDCYYNFQRYAEGDRIVTNEPCLNCTCHSRMLMCYLRVCPFSKAIGQDCKVEKRPDQCCPVITCPEVPVHLLTSTSTTEKVPSDTAVAFPDTYGCSIDGRFFPDGVQVPSNPEKPCELCYCIRNRTACVMQECTLQVEGCKPVLQPGVCCPVRYDCDYGDEPSATERPPPSGLILSTPTTPGPAGCTAGGYLYHDGDRVRGRTPCEHCYCMRGDVVCAVQECGPALQGCRALPPKPGRCCADAFQCANGTVSLEILSHDQNAPEPPSQPIPPGSVEDKHKQVASTSGLPAEETQTESLKDDVATEEKFATTEKYEPTTVPLPSEVGTPVKGVKGEVGFEEPTTTKYIPKEPSSQPEVELSEGTTTSSQSEEELPEGTTTRIQLPEMDPLGGTHTDDSLPTTTSPAIDKETAPSGESHDVSHDDAETDPDQNNQASNVVTTEPSLPKAPTAQVSDDKIEGAAVTSEPLIETDDKTTATFVTSSDEYFTTSSPQLKPTCEKHGQIFELSDPVPANLVTNNPCVVNCTCQSKNAITCSVINCPPSPPHHKNCAPIRHEGLCCPTYACDGVEAPEPESDNQMAIVQDGSNEGDEVTTTAPKAEDHTLVAADFSRRTTSDEISNYVPLKDATTAMPDNADQPTTIQPDTESVKEPSASAEKIDKPLEDSQAVPVHHPVETEHHSYDQGAHSHDGGETHEDSDSHPDFDHDILPQSGAPEDADHDTQPATEEPKEPPPLEGHEVTHSEAAPSLQDGDEIKEQTQKPSHALVTASPDEIEHETSHQADVPTTQHYESEDVGNVINSSSVLTDAAESDGGHNDNAYEPSDSEDHVTADTLDHSVSPTISESQVTTENPSESVATTLAESDHKGPQADHDDNADDLTFQTTVAAPVKEDETITEPNKYQTTEKPDAVVLQEHDLLPSIGGSTESSSVDESQEENATPTPHAQAELVESASDSIQSVDTATDEPIKAEPTDFPPNAPTEKPADLAMMELATVAPAEVINDLPATEDASATDSSTEIVHSTEPPKSSEISSSDLTTVVPETTGAPSHALSDVNPEDISGSPTESLPTAEPSAGTDRPVNVDQAPPKPEESSTGTSAPLEEATNKPVAPLVEDQSEKDSEDSSSATETVPVTPGEPESPSHNSDEGDVGEESGGTEEPAKDIENQPEKPSATVSPFVESTPEKDNVLSQDGQDNKDESATVTSLAPEASTEVDKAHSPEGSPTQSPVTADGGEEPTQGVGSTDKPVAPVDQPPHVFDKMPTLQPESQTEIPSHIHTEAVNTDDEPLDLQPTTEIPLKSVSSDSNGLATTETSVSSNSNSVTEQSTELPEGTPQSEGAPQSEGTQQPEGTPQPEGTQQSEGAPQPEGTQQPEGSPQPDSAQQSEGAPQPEGTQQPVTEPSEAEQLVTTAGLPPKIQDHFNEDPDKISHDQSAGKPETSSDYGENVDNTPEDHTQYTNLVTLPDLADKIQDELGHHADGATGIHDLLVGTPDEVVHNTETPGQLPADHTDKSPVDTEQDPADGSAAESSHDPTVGAPDEILHEGHTDETPIEMPHDTTEGTPVKIPNVDASVDITEEPLETSHDHTEGTPVEFPHDPTEGTPEEIPHDHTEGTPVETPHDHTEGTPVETPHDHTEGTPVESPHDNTVGAPVESPHDHTEGTPVESPLDNTEGTPVEIPHAITEGSPVDISHDNMDVTQTESPEDHTEGAPIENPQVHIEGPPAETPEDHTVVTSAEFQPDHTEETLVESDDHISHQQTDRSPSEDHTESTPVETPQNHADEIPPVAHDHTEGTLPENPQDHTVEALPENTTEHSDGTPLDTVVDHAEHDANGHGVATEAPHSQQTAHPTQAVTEAQTQSQSEVSFAQTVTTLLPYSPALDQTPEDINLNNAVDSAEPAPTNGETLVQMTTESIDASQTSEPVLTETVEPHHDHFSSITDKPSESPKQPGNLPEGDEMHTTEVSIATVVPEHTAHIPVENLEGLLPAAPEETTTQPNAQDKFETQPGSQSDIPQEPVHDIGGTTVGTDTESEPHTTALPEGSQGLKGQTLAEPSTESAPAEPEHLPATVSEQISSQSTDSSADEGLKESSTPAAEVELPTTASPSQEKGPLPSKHTPSVDLMDQEEVTTQSLVDRITVLPQTHEQTSVPEEHTEKQSDNHVTEPATNVKPEHSTYPAHKDRPTTVTHEEPTTPPKEHTYTTTPSPVTEATSKAPFHPPVDDFEEQDHVHEHEYTHNNVPTIPPAIFGGGQIDEEHPPYGSHLPSTPSHNHFPPDDSFPVDSYPDEDDPGYGPGTCRYAGKVYVSAQQIPRDDPCDFCFCFRSDIICLQQSCPPPIPGCHEEPISGFCCPRYECPVSMATSLNLTTTSTTTTTTLPPHFLPHAYHGAATRTGCQVRGVAYRVGETVRSASGPCLHCRCGGDGQMQCEPKVCSPEPMLRKMIAAAATRRR